MRDQNKVDRVPHYVKKREKKTGAELGADHDHVFGPHLAKSTADIN